MSASKAKGTAFETLVLGAVQQYRPQARRSPAAGNQDVGDIYIPGEERFVLECKNVKATDLSGWLAEAREEADRANGTASGAVVVHKRRGKGDAFDQYVTLTLGDFLDLVYRTYDGA